MKDWLVERLFDLSEAGGPWWWRMLFFRLGARIFGRRRMVQAVRDYNAERRQP